MRTPSHWQSRNWLSYLLYPLSCCYALVTALRMKLHQPYKAPVPVICIGNLTAGGVGKTPVAASIAEILKKSGYNPFIISRGYGGTLSDILVDINIHSAAEVGDEPLLLARITPVVINPRRDKAAQIAIENGADIIVMDDGFQNPYLYKDKSLLVIDGMVGLGNQMPIPSGPLREFISQGLKRADGIIILGEDKHRCADFACKMTLITGKITPDYPQDNTGDIIAFAGIGRPAKFYQSLKECGFNVVKTYDFPDHHFYTQAELQSIIDEGKKLNTPIYTTAKDMVKIPHKLLPYFNVLNIEVKWDNPELLQKFITSFK